MAGSPAPEREPTRSGVEGDTRGAGRPKALLFDLDGVLIQSGELWLEALSQASARFGGRAVTREEFLPSFGQGTQADIDQFGLRCSVSELDHFFAEVFPAMAGEVWTDPDALGMLQALRRERVALAVATNTASHLAHRLLAAGGLDAPLSFVACSDLVARPKPAPDMLLLALEALGAAPSEAWMVGDSAFDRDAAAAAGLLFVGYRQAGDLRIDSLGELPSLVTAHLQRA